MKVIKRGRLPGQRAVKAAKTFSSRAVCGNCESVLEFHANDLKTYCVPGQLKVVCPVCVRVVEVDEGGIPPDVLLYVKLVHNGEIKRFGV